MVNGIDISTYADVILRDLSGAEITRQRINFSPHSQQRLEIAQALLMSRSPASVGSIMLIEPADRQGTAILAQLTMTYLGSKTPNYLDEEASMPDAEGSQTLRGVTDRSKHSPIVSISSLAEMPQNVTIQCLSESGPSFSKIVRLLANETLVTEACNRRTIHGGDLDAVSDQRDDKTTERNFGISLTTDGMPGSFAAFGLVRHNEDGDRYHSVFSLDDPKMSMSATKVFTGVPVGSARLISDGNYVPHVSLANFSSKPVRTAVKYSQMIDNIASARTVAELTISPRSTKEFALDILNGNADLQNSFVVSSDAAPGDLAVKLTSVSDSELREVELESKDEIDSQDGGNHPWSLEDGTESTLLLFNTTDQPQIFNVVVSAGTVRWSKAFSLASMQTMAVSIRNLIHARVKDDFSVVLPQDTQSGELSWFTAESKNGKGRVLQSNRGLGMARNFSCGTIIVECSVGLSLSGSGFSDGNGDPFGSLTPHYCRSSSQTNCPGDNVAASTGATYSWWSNATGTAAISGSSTSQSSSVIGVAAGSTTVQGQASFGRCTGGGSGPANVFTGVLTPQDNFTGRSTTRFGIAEVINLSFNSTQTAAALGGLQWSIVSGGGSLANAGTGGTATYTAPGSTTSVILRLAVVAGSSQGRHRDYTISIVAPSGGLLAPFGQIRHTQGFISVGFQAHLFVQPTDVSFLNVSFAEGTATATATGYFASLNGAVHPAGSLLPIGSCDAVLGCELTGMDTVDTNDDPPPFSAGDFLWPIPWVYQVSGGTLTTYTTANHHQTADASGTATISKAGAGPFSKNASDPTTSF